MKKTLLLCAIGASVALLSGCAGSGNLLLSPGKVDVLRPAQTNLVAIVVTNLAPDGLPQVVTNLQPIILPAITYTNMELSAVASGTIKAAGVAGGLAGVPFSGAIAQGLLAVISLALSWLAVRAKRKLQAEIDGHAETSESLAVAQDVAKTLVLNLETLRKTALTIPGYTADVDNKVMTVIQQVQEAAGVKGVVNDIVDANTGYTLGGEAAK